MRFSELDGATVGVWGAGREIRSFAAQLARRLPAARIAVVASDQPLAAGVLGEARPVTGAEIVGALAGCDVVVRSPGVSLYRPELRELGRRGVTVTTATALWLAEVGGADVIGVTGTKGKSTTAALIHHLAGAAGRAVALAGNIGVPAVDLLDRPAGVLAVVELSSYQIADLTVGPEVAVVTNLYREHLDWHGSEAAYRADKLRLLGLPGVRASVLNARDPALCGVAGAAPSPVLYGTASGWDVTADGVAFRGATVVSREDLPLPGEHNALNLCAALGALGAAGVALPELAGALPSFVGLPHRLELVLSDGDGVRWVDDSISTTPESTLAALSSFAGREVVLLAGGTDRGQDYGGLGRALAARDAAVVGLPVTGARLIDAARRAGLGAGRAVGAPDMEAAVALARGLARRPGGVVLLSPAAPSFHAYRDFEERGDHFRALAGGG